MVDQVFTQVRARSHWREYVALLRFPYHLSFVGVLLGVLIVTRHWSEPLVSRILLLYLSSTVLLYGGIYTLNAITDAEADRMHPFKRSRPVASGAVSLTAASLFAASLVLVGFLTGWMCLGREVIPVYLLLLALNLSYSLLFRNVPVLDVIFNSATHPPRFWLGMWLAGGSSEWDWLALVFLFAVGMSARRRAVMLVHGAWEWNGAIAKHSQLVLLVIRAVAFGAIVILWVLRGPRFQLPYLLTLGAYVVLVGGIEFVPRIRSAFERLWLR